MQTSLAGIEPKETIVFHEKSIRKRTRENSEWDKVTNLHTLAPQSRRGIPLLPQWTQRERERERERERKRYENEELDLSFSAEKIWQGN